MKIRLCILAMAWLASGCSEESNPVTATPEPQDDGYLARVYEQSYAGRPYYLFTSARYVALRFDTALSAEQVSAFLTARSLQVKRTPDPRYRLYVVAVKNAFTQAAGLAANPEIVYLGPVFERDCGTRYLLVGNQITIYDVVTNASVDSVLQAENATLIEAKTDHPNAIRHTYELPWGPADHVFDLCLYLTNLVGVTYCEPNYVLPCQ